MAPLSFTTATGMEKPINKNSRSSSSSCAIPKGVQTASFWIDESGSKTTAGKCYVAGGIKTRHPDDLQRNIKAIREQHSYEGEFKFSRITDVNLPRIFELIDVLEASDAKLVATVVDGTKYNPFKGVAQWEAHAAIISRLVIGNLNKNEIATVVMDGISTPPGCSLGRNVKRGVNSQLHATAVTQAFSLDSKCNDLLQAADLVAGAIFNQRMGRAAHDSAKAKVARRLATVFDLTDLMDQRSRRVNIATLEPARTRIRALTVVKPSRAVS